MPPEVMQQYEDAFPDHLEEAVSQKYLPRRQRNPHLKKYYSGKRALPWRLSTLAARVSGSEYDLDEYRKYLWEQEKKSKLKEKRRQERAQRKHDSLESDNENPRRRKKTHASTQKDMTKITKEKVDNKNNKSRPEAKCRRHLSHLMSALKATSKRQGWLQYYTYCSCCYIYDRPRILREQTMKRSLPLIMAEGLEEAGAQRQWTVGERPRNSQNGRARFHEGREKALQILQSDKKRRMRSSWDGLGGRGVRAWMKQDLKHKDGREPDDHDEETFFGLKDIAVQEPFYWVRYVGLKRGQVVLHDGLDETSLEPDYRDFEEADLSSDSGSDIWLHEEWVCLSVDGGDGSGDEMGLSWIEVDDITEDDEY